MNKTELENAIKNSESVWYADYNNGKVWKINLKERYKPEIYLNTILYVYHNINDRFKLELFISNIYKTKAEAEHYLHHANVTRTEWLPFVTWEEFLENKNFEFFDKNGILTWLYINTSKTSESIHLNNRFEKLNDWELTEENFYKAYDECVRLFKGE